MTFATGPNIVSCPSCRVPSGLTVNSSSESGTFLGGFTRSTGGKLVNVLTLTSSDISSVSGQQAIFESGGSGSSPATGFVVQTATSPPPGQPVFNVLFPLAIR